MNLLFLLVFTSMASAQTTSLYTAPANPLVLAAKLKSNTSVTQFINAAKGGQLEILDSTGTKYQLSIPADAIFQGTEFKMTVIDELGGESNVSRDKTWGVQIEPAGLVFNKNATLKITPSRAIDPKTMTPFSYYSGGENVHLTQGVINGGTVVIPLQHLSGYGVVESMPFRRDAAAHLSNLLRDRLGNLLVLEVIKLQSGEIAEIPADFALNKAEEFFEQVIRPSMGPSKSSYKSKTNSPTSLKIFVRIGAVKVLKNI